MERRRSRALLLEVRDLQERDRIVTFLTAEHGRLSGVANGARRKYSRYQGRLEPWSLVDLSWTEKPGRELVRIGDVDLVRSGHALRGSLEALLAASYLAEHVRVIVQENESAFEVFRLLDRCLQRLAVEGAEVGLLLRYFEFWMLKLAGVFPDVDRCAACGASLTRGFLTAEADGVVGPCCGADAPGGAALSGGALELLRAFRATAPDRLEALRPSPRAVGEVETVCGQIRRAFLGEELRSYGVMRRTLGDGRVR